MVLIIDTVRKGLVSEAMPSSEEEETQTQPSAFHEENLRQQRVEPSRFELAPGQFDSLGQRVPLRVDFHVSKQPAGLGVVLRRDAILDEPGEDVSF